MTDRSVYMTLEGLRRRGWTDGMVHALLGEPDVQGRNPRLWSVAPVRLYLLARVEAVERTPEFGPCARAGAGPDATVARAAAERRRQAVLATIRAEPIRVPILPGPELERRAARHGRLLQARGTSGRCPGERASEAACDTPGAALVRWQVDYLRHALRSYDALLDGLFAATGRGEAERLLRERVYGAIAQAYPGLAEECRRRIGRGAGR
ncbi:hypothetical protein [Streptomyces sp. NPDC047928]|uniref:hypothetical protein n=1 Tax=unclassified Streptomyces TaxID=2593676 RepID=UPI00371B87E5